MLWRVEDCSKWSFFDIDESPFQPHSGGRVRRVVWSINVWGGVVGTVLYQGLWKPGLRGGRARARGWSHGAGVLVQGGQVGRLGRLRGCWLGISGRSV